MKYEGTILHPFVVKIYKKCFLHQTPYIDIVDIDM